MRKVALALPVEIADHYGDQIEQVSSQQLRLLPVQSVTPITQDLSMAEIALHAFWFGSLGFADVLPALSHVKWIHSTGAGIDDLAPLGLEDRDLWITNAAGIFAPGMAEYTVWAMVMMARRPSRLLRAQQQNAWASEESADQSWQAMLTSSGSEIHGKQVGIIGYGSIGRHVATACQGLGMTVWAVRRTPIPASSEPIDRLMPPADVGVLLAKSDFVVLAASLNSTSRGLMGDKELRGMKKGAFLINLARGELVDQSALHAALRDGHLGGAILDVASPEPLPSSDPLWTAPNVWITPHISGDTPEAWKRGIDLFCANLRLYLDGHPERMANLVQIEAHR